MVTRTQTAIELKRLNGRQNSAYDNINGLEKEHEVLRKDNAILRN